MTLSLVKGKSVARLDLQCFWGSSRIAQKLREGREVGLAVLAVFVLVAVAFVAVAGSLNAYSGKRLL